MKLQMMRLIKNIQLVVVCWFLSLCLTELNILPTLKLLLIIMIILLIVQAKRH